MSERPLQRPSYTHERDNGLRSLRSLDAVQIHFAELYGRRNEIYLSGRPIRIDLLHAGISDLNNIRRKTIDPSMLSVMLARVVSRVFCVAHGINSISIAEGMEEKYPLEGCVYCHSNPCQCEERRQAADIGWGRNALQKEWGLAEWQEHLKKLYGEKNHQKGLDYILNRLMGETGELISIERTLFLRPMNEIEHEYQLELADALAWTMAAANFFGINIQGAAIDRYGNGCGTCGQKPCACGPHSFNQVRI